MGLLDDLRNQAEGKRSAEEEEAARRAEREQYYQEKMLPRMIKAYQFFNEFVEHLNYIQLKTIINYPLLPDGAPQSLRQEGYKVVIDSSKALKRIDFSMEGVLDAPVPFEIFGKDAVLKHADRIERYSFRHDRKDKKDPTSMELVAAKFTLLGPLPLKITVEANVDTSQIIVTVRNFKEPGFTKYNLTVEQFSDEFLDQLGKFVLRQEDRLFGKSEELSEEARKKLRDRMIVEARIRQQELIEAEQRRQAEEAAEKEKSAKHQIKHVVNTKVAQGKESLKDMFNKLKKQAGFVESPEQKQTPALTKTIQPTQATQVAPAQSTQAIPTAASEAKIPAPAAPIDRAAQKQPAPVENVVAKSESLSNGAVTPNVSKQQTTTPPPAPSVSTPTPAPKVFEAPTPNPFLTPKPPVAKTVAEDQPVADKSDSESTASTTSSANPLLSSEALEQDLARIIERDKLGNSGEKPAIDQPDATSSANPFLTPATSKPAAASAQKSAAAKPVNPANPFLQTSATKTAKAQPQPPADTSESPKPKSKPVLRPGELNTSLSESLAKSQADQLAEKKPLSEVKDPTQNPFLKPGEMDLDLTDNMDNIAQSQANNDSKENS